jgi:hypothetical protein
MTDMTARTDDPLGADGMVVYRSKVPLEGPVRLGGNLAYPSKVRKASSLNSDPQTTPGTAGTLVSTLRIRKLPFFCGPRQSALFSIIGAVICH